MRKLIYPAFGPFLGCRSFFSEGISLFSPFSLFSLFSLFSPSALLSQTTRNVSVELTAAVQPDPPRITLNWVEDTTCINHLVYRKMKTSAAWGPIIANLSNTDTQFVDSTVNVGVSYEYRVLRQGSNYTGWGYINSGIEIPPFESRGKLILVVDETFKDTLSAEIERLKKDLEGDGWHPIQINVSRSAEVVEVKSMIVSIYNQDVVNTKALFLLGHVPVPYSGNINPDGHPDHLGAWPADVFYADVNGLWTDVSVNNVVAADPRHDNIPKDGKFDNSILPSDVELQIGRVDFANMPAFPESEQQLLKNYLDKDHAYRYKMFTPAHRGVIDDNFGYFGAEAFAASGWKNLSPLVGSENVIADDYFLTMRDSSYLWSYGCGGGSYVSAGGIGSTSDFVVSDLKSVFTMLFGSYFGDWDAQNNFLRAPLAQGMTLTNAWSGRPHWMFHHMALGENIGYSTRLSQNNNTIYFGNYGLRFVHIALMGDPTLRNDVVSPVTSVTADPTIYGSWIFWEPSPEPVMGYHVYRRDPNSTEYVRLNEEPVMGLFFEDPCVDDAGVYSYMVRALTLETSPSGTYYNLSQGITADVNHSGAPDVEAEASWDIDVTEVSFDNLSGNADTYLWIFGDGETSTEENPTHTYLAGLFQGMLIASNQCGADTFHFEITIITGLEDIGEDPTIILSPNPSTGKFSLSWPTTSDFDADIRIYAATGELVFEQNHILNGSMIDLSGLPEGIYFMHVVKEGSRSIKRVVIQK